MKTTKLHTLEEILTQGISVDGQDSPTRISCLFIPKIQRSYAQGRKNENEIRTDFLDDIFATLISTEETPLELSFLFGSKQPLVGGASDGFELLDGQQRTTTLFLLYWYIYVRESETVPDYLKRFTYETRDTSTTFLSKITSTSVRLGNSKPSIVLKANKWFTDDFNCDPTICAMLNMLDEIHIRYNSYEGIELADKLSRLKFYVLLLEKFDMNDELYIKMNSRGLSLIPFENFKASIVRYMKKHPQAVYGSEIPTNGQMPYWLHFTSKLDATWIDIFWQNPTSEDNSVADKEIVINDEEIGNRYFRFFNRYFFTKAALIKGVENRKIHPLVAFFYNDCENDETERRLIGWPKYIELFEDIEKSQIGQNLPATKYPVFSAIEIILDTYLKNRDFILDCVYNDPYGNTTDFDVLTKEHYDLPDRVIFAAVTEFIESLPSGSNFEDENVKENFKRMFRVVHNIIENTTLESDVATIGVINAVSEIIHFKESTNGNFYESLARNELKSRNSQLRDEKEKAEEMFTSGQFDPLWEEAFIGAEKHPFFKGSITFFFTPKAGGCGDFTNRFNVMKELFDEKGISEQYRTDEHILIRALLSCLNHWDRSGLQDRYFTENVEKQKYLKTIVTSSPEVRTMFCNYFADTSITMKDYLKNMVMNAACNPEEQNISFKMLYNRLINDAHASAIYDEVAERESHRGCFRIQNNRSYVILIPSKWYDQLVLDTERNIIIPFLLQNHGFSFTSKEQHNQFNSALKDCWYWSIELQKDINANGHYYKIRIVFDEYKHCWFYVYGQNAPDLEAVFNIKDNTIKDGIQIPDYVFYQFDKDKQAIIDKIEYIENEIKKIK